MGGNGRGRTVTAVVGIVLNWNGYSETERCIASLRASNVPLSCLVVVDNGSTDGSAERLRAAVQPPWGRLIENATNRGFTGGVNAGLRAALELEAEYIFLLNNDATVEPETLGRLLEAAAADDTIGLAGPMIVWSRRPERVWSAGSDVSWSRAAIEAGRDQPIGAVPRERRRVDGLSACALLARRAVLERAGLLDERYFAYYEDLDWCLRARRAGFSCLFVGDARAYHDGSTAANRGGGRSQSALVNYYGARNALLFMATHAPPAQRPLALAVLGARLLASEARILAGGVILRRPDATRRARAIAYGAADALCGRFGPGRGGLL